jgi:phospholipase/carboxylesterase
MRLSLVHAVREPSGKAPETPPPLLILLHGVGSNEQDLIGLAPALDPRFYIVSARAPITLGQGAFGWYHVQFTPTTQIINPDEAESSRKLLLKFIDEVLEAYTIDPSRVYLLGFSQGCIMSIAAALTQPDKFAGIVGMSGRLLPNILEKAVPPGHLKGLPVLVVHGTADSVLSITEGRAIRDALQQLPVDLTYREYAMGHHVSEESLNDISDWLTARLDSPDWRSKSE